MAELDFYPLDIVYRVENKGNKGALRSPINPAEGSSTPQFRQERNAQSGESQFAPLSTPADGESATAQQAMQPVIELYGKGVFENSQLRPVSVSYSSFLPYFWVVPDQGMQKPEEAAAQLAMLKADNPELKIVGTELHTKNYLGKEVKAIKVLVNVPAAVPQLREKARNAGTVLEADIAFTRRFLIDKRIMPLSLYKAQASATAAIDEPDRKARRYDAQMLSQVSEEALQDIRILAIDIETHNPLGKTMLPDEHPVIMAALCGEGFRKVITWKKFPTKLDYVEFVNSELELLERIKHHIEQHKPDMITGYFSDAFDLPYIKARADRYKLKLDIGLDGSQIRINRTAASTTAEITGIVHIDLFKFVRKVMFSSLETTVYDLASVTKELLNETKAPVDIDKLYLAWDNHDMPQLEAYCAYNMQDAQLTFNLCKKLMPSIVELTRTIGLPLFDVSRMSYSQLVEWYLIKQAKDFNELVPNRPNRAEEIARRATSYQGAFVYEPTPGLYKDITVFDFMSLYPTIISAHNISPDTINCECCRNSAQNRVPGEEGLWFCTKRKGFIPTVINEVIKRRIRVKEIMKAAGSDKTLNARQQALKTIANSMYGYFGYFGARWYSIECAKAITAYGRSHIQSVIEEAKSNGFKVLYSDTDSLFIALDGKTKDDAMAFVAEVNKSLPGMMELDYEGFYPAGIFVGLKGTNEGKEGAKQGAKKKYAIIAEDGTVKIRGFEMVRRNLSPIAKETQEKVLDIILKDNNIQAAYEHAKGVIGSIRGRKAPVEKIIITTQLQKEIGSYESFGPHVAAAQRMKAQGLPAGPGSIIRYVIVQGKERIRDRARLPEEVKEGEYDAEYYIKNQVVPAIGKIFEIFGYDAEELAEEKTQQKLQAWFG